MLLPSFAIMMLRKCPKCQGVRTSSIQTVCPACLKLTWWLLYVLGCGNLWAKHDDRFPFHFVTWHAQDVRCCSLLRVIPKDWSKGERCRSVDPCGRHGQRSRQHLLPIDKAVDTSTDSPCRGLIWTWRENWQTLDSLGIGMYWITFAKLGSNAASRITDDKKWWYSRWWDGKKVFWFYLVSFCYLPLVVECWDFSFWVTPTQSLTKKQGRTTMAQERIRAVLGFWNCTSITITIIIITTTTIIIIIITIIPPTPPTLNGEKMWDADICSRLFKDCKKSIIVTSNKCLGVRVQIPFSVLDSWTSYHMWIEENMLMSIYTHVCILPIWENDAVCAYLCWEGLRTWEIYNWKGEYRYEICDMWNWQI